MKSVFLARALAAAGLVLPALLSTSADACSSCGCSLNSDWASQGYSADRGLRFDLRYDYFNQDQLRTGTGVFDRAAAPVPNDRELQLSTIDRNLNLGIDYSPQRDWGIAVQIPVFDRPHSTLAEGDDELSYSRSRGIGDIRVLGRFQGFSADRSLGVQVGLKLPTGRTDYNFRSGPEAGTPLDRGLQPGTGTTDLLLGVYHYGSLNEEVGYFANALAQLPLNANQGFRPGAGINMNAGIRYLSAGAFAPQLQINVRSERRETGINADTDNSGSTLINLSPGFSLDLGGKTSLYAFVQVPLYQRVNGLQLEPRYSVSMGLRWAM